MGTRLLVALSKMFPVTMVAATILDLVRNATIDDALAIVGAPSLGAYYHPSDIADVFRALRRRYPEAPAWIKTLGDGLWTFDYAPRPAMRVGGSVVTYVVDDGTSQCANASAVLVLDGALPKRKINVAEWIRVQFQPDMDVWINAAKIDGVAAKAEGIQVRVMAYRRKDPATCHDVWATWAAPGWTPRATAVLSSKPGMRERARRVEDIVDMSADEHVIFRVDVFYPPKSVLDDPMIL
jgi:hypothetical protein